MSDAAKPTPADRGLKELTKTDVGSFDVKGEGSSEAIVDAIEMIGEERASGLRPPPETVTAGMRYLHCSRTIHQLVTDRNRAVGIYLAVASLLMTASGAIYNARPQGDVIVPFELIQKWCLPITFAVLTALAVLMAFLLIRTRVGMIYEVAKMNALLGLPLGRVSHVNPLSIFFILQAIISLAGGFTASMFSYFMIWHRFGETAHAGWVSAIVGLLVTGGLIALYAITVNVTTADEKLRNLK